MQYLKKRIKNIANPRIVKKKKKQAKQMKNKE